MAHGPDFMWEIVNSVHLLQNKDGAVVFDGWRRHVRTWTGRPRQKAAIRTLTVLAPYADYIPDFLTPVPSGDSLMTSIDTVLCTPRKRMHAEMTRLSNARQLPSWARQVAEGHPDTLRGIGSAIQAYFRNAIEPYLPHIDSVLRVEYNRRAQVLLRGGAEALLSDFTPLLRWVPPVLHVDYPVDRDLYLAGRGLTLMPSFFCWRRPIMLADPELPPILVYPVQHGLDWLGTEDTPGRPGRGLAALIGATRAEVLRCLLSGGTTTEVARLVGISPATATHHMAVLRGANLISTQREGATVQHAVTRLGESLLESLE
jgi:DNA-binding transcriptional ArsR family regulator/BMFP domain-containing protein YqiC